MKNSITLINDFNKSPEIFNPKKMSITEDNKNKNNFSNNKFEENISMAL